MKKRLLTAFLSAGLLFSTAAPAMAVVTPHHCYYYHDHHCYQSQAEYLRHRQHMKTLKRTGIGAAGGAVVGGLAAGGAGAGIGALAGGGAGYLYNRYKKHHH